MTDAPRHSPAYLVGGGIASLAAAVFLVRGGGLACKHFRILPRLLARAGRRALTGCA